MPVKDGRQYRNFSAGLFAPVQEKADTHRVRGYFTTFDEPYELYDGVFEKIDPHALDGADFSDLIMQFDHRGQVLARTSNGSLEFGIDEHGGWCEASLSGCAAARDLYEAIGNGLVTQMSWGFLIADGGWQYDRDTRTSTITRVSKVYDVSAVSIPANPGTEIQARSYLDGAIEAALQAERLAEGSGETGERELERMRAIVRMNLI